MGDNSLHYLINWNSYNSEVMWYT